MFAIYIIGYLITVVGISVATKGIEPHDIVLLSIIWPYVWFLILFVCLPPEFVRCLKK